MAANISRTDAVTCSRCGAHLATSTGRALSSFIAESVCVWCNRPGYGPASW